MTDHTIDIVNAGGGKFKLPLIHPNKPGKNANLRISIEEGRLYRLNSINFVGVKLFRTPETLMRPVFQMQQGDVFSTAKLRKGFEDLRKLYGQFGYIDFVSEPNIEPVPGTDKIDLTLNFDHKASSSFRAAHRFFRQHHHARQRHSPRTDDRRRRRV